MADTDRLPVGPEHLLCSLQLLTVTIDRDTWKAGYQALAEIVASLGKTLVILADDKNREHAMHLLAVMAQSGEQMITTMTKAMEDR